MSDTPRKLTRREFIRLTAGAAGAALLASCAPAAQPTTAPAPTSAPAAAATKAPAAAPTVPPVVKSKVEITWWRSLEGVNGNGLEELVKRFNASQDRVTVKSEFQGSYAPLRDKFTAAVAAGGSALPDCVMLADVMYLAFARNKRLEPLDDFAKGSNGVNLADYYSVVDRGRVDNVLYQLPLGVSTPVFYYNEDALKKAGFDGAPKTWDQFFDVVAPKVTVQDGGKTSQYGFVFWQMRTGGGNRVTCG